MHALTGFALASGLIFPNTIRCNDRLDEPLSAKSERIFAERNDPSLLHHGVGSLHESSAIIIELEFSAEAEQTDHHNDQSQLWADDLQDMLDDYD